MSTTSYDESALPTRSNRELKILPNPSAFFDILVTTAFAFAPLTDLRSAQSESDVAVRSKKLNNIELQFEEEEPLKDGSQSEMRMNHERVPDVTARSVLHDSVPLGFGLTE